MESPVSQPGRFLPAAVKPSTVLLLKRNPNPIPSTTRKYTAKTRISRVVKWDDMKGVRNRWVRKVGWRLGEDPIH